jgi:predicted Zn-dependent peptidase
LKTMLAFKSEDPEFLTEWYGRQELFGLTPLLTLREYYGRIDAVTKIDIDTLIRKYFVTNHLNLAVVWSRKEDTGLKELLRY